MTSSSSSSLSWPPDLVSLYPLKVDDILPLLSQFALEHRLVTTARALQVDTGVFRNYCTVHTRETLIRCVTEGHWSELSDLMSECSWKWSEESVDEWFEVMLMEFIEEGQRSATHHLLETSSHCQMWKKRDKERYQRVMREIERGPLFIYSSTSTSTTQARHLYQSDPPPDTRLQRRQKVLRLFERELTLFEPGRLLALLNQALNYQQLQGVPVGLSAATATSREDVLTSGDNAIVILPGKVRKIIRSAKDTYCTCLSYSPDGRWLLIGTSDGFLEIYDAVNGKVSHAFAYQARDELMQHESGITCLAWSRTCDVIASATKTGELKVWHVQLGTCIRSWAHAHDLGIASCEFSSQDKSLLLTCGGDCVKLFGIKSGQCLREFSFMSDSTLAPTVNALWSDDNESILSFHTTGVLCRFKKSDMSSASPEQVAKILSAREQARAMIRSTDNGVFVLSNNALRLVDTRNLCQLKFFALDELQRLKALSSLAATSLPTPISTSASDEFAFVVLNAQATFALVVTIGCILYAFDIATGEFVSCMRLHEAAEINAIAAHPHKTAIASAARDLNKQKAVIKLFTT